MVIISDVQFLTRMNLKQNIKPLEKIFLKIVEA